MKLEEYSDKAFVVRGEYTKKYINELKSMVDLIPNLREELDGFLAKDTKIS